VALTFVKRVSYGEITSVASGVIAPTNFTFESVGPVN